MFSKRFAVIFSFLLVAAVALTPVCGEAVVVKNLAGYKLGPGKYSYDLGQSGNVAYSSGYRMNVANAISYKIEVQNGSTRGKERVSSANISIGGTEVFSQKDFNQNVTELMADLTPEDFGSGRLNIRINGKPGSYLVIKVSALVPDDPLPRAVYYRDYDLDTYGDPAKKVSLPPGSPPPAGPPPGSSFYFEWVDKGGDCNDQDATIFPGVKGCPPLR